MQIFTHHPLNLKRLSAISIVISAATIATPAIAETRIRLVKCKTEACLLVTGHRTDRADKVSINGHSVTVTGARKWRVSVPFKTVRAWSAPFARTITVKVADVESQPALPTGMLGSVENLASLIVRVK
jgi:hypothetical protein